MSMFIAHTNVKELIVSVERVYPGFVDIFIYNMTYTPDFPHDGLPKIPSFKLEHVAREVKATFDNILTEVKRGINYHFIWSDDGDDPRSGTIDEFKYWLTEKKIEQEFN